MSERTDESGESGGFPRVVGRCPACNGKSLFLGAGGYVTCSVLGCSDRSAATTLLERWNVGIEPGSGAQRIAAERQRQIMTEGYGYGHDDAYDDTSLLDAASCYLDWTISEAAGDDPEEYYGKLPAQWPRAARHFKPDGIERNLEKAGALIAAELDRRRRAIERGDD